MGQLWDIQFKNLRLGYGENVVLDDISAVLPAKRISAILGGSGCGKSTLLRHIIGLSRPMSGEIRVGGTNIFSIPHHEFRNIKRHMGVLFQDGALLGSLTVGENVGLSLREHTRIPKATIRKVALSKLDLVGLADFIDYYPTELSGGMRKRAGLARALVTDPSILLCDEPTSGLDPISAAQMDALLLSLKKHFPEMMIACVSHDMASVKNIADHILVLHDKKIIFEGSPSEFDSTTNTYLRQFIDRKASQEEQKKNKQVALSDAVKKEVSAALAQWLNK